MSVIADRNDAPAQDVMRPEIGPGRLFSLANLALLVIVTLTTLLVLEFAARWFLSDIGTTGKSADYLSRRWYAQHPPSMNTLGFREREFSGEPARGVYRIAAVGDSFTFGAGILPEERISDRLERRLNEGGQQKFEILNFGVPGANYAEHAQNMKVAIDKAHPDYILLQWYLNDLDDPVDKRPRPAPFGFFLHKPFTSVSALYLLANRAFSDLQIKLGIVDVDAYYARFAQPGDPLARKSRQRFRGLVSQARGAGIPIGIYFWPELTRPIGTGPNDRLIDDLLAICVAERITCIDLRRALSKEKDHARLIVNRFDPHGSGYANLLGANLIYRKLWPTWKAQADSKDAAQSDALRHAPVD